MNAYEQMTREWYAAHPQPFTDPKLEKRYQGYVSVAIQDITFGTEGLEYIVM
jgi:hypothetical protein